MPQTLNNLEEKGRPMEPWEAYLRPTEEFQQMKQGYEELAMILFGKGE
jgi:hypothetical protein